MLHIKKFSTDESKAWNEFVKDSRNGSFLFDRQYMEYHANRFIDHSLLFYNDDELLSVLPASEKDGTLTSHGGLTFGGLLLHKRTSAAFVISAMDALINYLRKNELHTLIYKCIPYIYHRMPSQEDLYAITRVGGSLTRRDLSSAIDFSNRPSYTKGTKYNLSKARKNNLRVEKSNDFKAFMDIEASILQSKFGIQPTHTAQEMELLAERFPGHIKLFLVFKEQTCVGGTIIYETDNVAHTQYIGITDEGKEMGALDTVIDYLLQRYSTTHKYFSFGISTVEQGKVLNEGLLRNKESFGARAIIHDFYKIEM
jgi:hypothetical protein